MAGGSGCARNLQDKLTELAATGKERPGAIIYPVARPGQEEPHANTAIPSGRQTFDYDCGTKALQMVMAYYGVDARED